MKNRNIHLSFFQYFFKKVQLTLLIITLKKILKFDCLTINLTIWLSRLLKEFIKPFQIVTEYL